MKWFIISLGALCLLISQFLLVTGSPLLIPRTYSAELSVGPVISGSASDGLFRKRDDSEKTSTERSDKKSEDKTSDKSDSTSDKKNDESSKTTATSEKSSKSDEKSTSKDNTKTTHSTTQSSSTKKTSTGKSSATTSSVSINPVLPAGGIELVTPVTTDATYIKIGSNATFAWNYTNLIVTPEYLNIEAYCESNSNTYTLAVSHDGDKMNFTWDTGKFQTKNSVRLINAQYTLQIYDAEKGMDSVASAGYLSPYNSYMFGVYAPQSQQALETYSCDDCIVNAASSQTESSFIKQWSYVAGALMIISTVLIF